MAIEPMGKDKVMRPSLIDAVDKINEIAAAVNLLDPAEIDAIETRVSTLETSTSGLSTRVDNLNTSVTQLQTTQTSQQSDIDNIKITLYTPLSAGANPTTTTNGGN